MTEDVYFTKRDLTKSDLAKLGISTEWGCINPIVHRDDLSKLIEAWGLTFHARQVLFEGPCSLTQAVALMQRRQK